LINEISCGEAIWGQGLYLRKRLLFNAFAEIAAKSHRVFAAADFSVIGLLNSNKTLWIMAEEGADCFDGICEIMREHDVRGFVAEPDFGEILAERTGFVHDETSLAFAAEQPLLPAPKTDGFMRPARQSDTAAITKILAAYYAEIHNLEITPDLPDCDFFVWNNKEIAAIGASSCSQRGIARINYVYTLPGHRRRGYAAALISALCANARSSNQIPALYVNSKNQPAAALYRALGFLPQGMLHIYNKRV